MVEQEAPNGMLNCTVVILCRVSSGIFSSKPVKKDLHGTMMVAFRVSSSQLKVFLDCVILRSTACQNAIFESSLGRFPIETLRGDAYWIGLLYL